MKSNSVFFVIIFILLLGSNKIQAQEAVGASGTNISGKGGTVSYTIGQVVYTANAGTNGSSIQGIQQAFEISEISGMDEIKGIVLSCSVFPNPTPDYIILKIEDLHPGNFSFQLCDANGKQLKVEELSANQTRIDMTNLVRSTYFLRITENNKTIKSFKIIKN